MSTQAAWDRFREYLCVTADLGLAVDVSRISFDESFLVEIDNPMRAAIGAMAELEQGAIANPDEHRQVGHYWLRSPTRAPNREIETEINKSVDAVRAFASGVHDGTLKPPTCDGFFIVLVLGIGGSALGTQFLVDALGSAADPSLIRFIDNTDPDGIDRVLDELRENLASTLTIVVSKSGGTRETRNAMLETKAAYEQAGLAFERHAVAVTEPGSALWNLAEEHRWLRVFPVWEWVGGRTSVLSTVGLLPAALMGFDTDALLAGAAACDEATREREWRRNPAALIAAMWWFAITRRGVRQMAVLPYRDRLSLLGRYLQQLVMESLGKRKDRDGHIVHQGLTVYGNKGSTDQHAYAQQLVDGANDFFVMFIRVLRLRETTSIRVEDKITSGDYLHGFWLGTRAALEEGGRESITISLDELNARTVGVLIALFERAVGLCAELMNVNAYHQPGVEAGKTAAARFLSLQREVVDYLVTRVGERLSASEIAAAIAAPGDIEAIYALLRHLDANDDHPVRLFSDGAAHPCDALFAVRDD